jgi:FAD/FMN-containing dehydrogenase
MHDRRPALVVRPTSSADVVAALRYAREEALVVAVRSGGHSMPGLSTCDGGIVIDLARMRGVDVDPVGRIGRVAGGTLIGALDQATQAHGLACNIGTVSHTGVAGLTLGGGMGRLQRKLGLSIDCLRAVELVTADGSLVRASEEANADLFWGVRGAGANFGIVTAFELALEPIGPIVVRGILTFPGERAREVLGAFRETMPGAPDELMASVTIGRAMLPERFPSATPGAPIITVSLTWSGALDEAHGAIGPFTGLGEPLAGAVERQTWLASQGANDEGLDWGHRAYTKSGFLGSLPDALLDAFVEHAARAPGDDVISLWAMGGAVGRVPESATAFTGRSAPFWVGTETVWDDPALDAAHIGWAREGIALIEPYRATGGYVNDVSESGDEAVVRASYGADKMARLVALKRAWDPDNVFRLNQNIRP